MSNKKSDVSINRRDFLSISGKTTAAAGVAGLFGIPSTFAEGKAKVKTNYNEMKKPPASKLSIPGPFPGKIVEVENSKVWAKEDKLSPKIIEKMVDAGMESLTGKKGSAAWKMFIKPDDVIGIKVNPVGGTIISTRPELVDVIIDRLVKAGAKKENIIIWDRCLEMLNMGGYTKERFPDVKLEALHTIDMQGGNSWKDKNGNHVDADNFDKEVYYWADVEGPKDDKYINQNVFPGKYSYFGKLVTKKLTKIINVPVMKNTGNGVSMATKNISYAAIVNTNRLHKPLAFDINTEVLGFPVIRDKMVLNILDGLYGQYEGGPMPNEKYVYKANKIMFATDPFAQDYIGYLEMLKKRKADPNVKVNNSPRYTEYMRYAEREGLGIGNPDKIKHKVIKQA